MTEKKLNSKQLKAINLLIRGFSAEKIATEIDVARSSIFRWKKKEAFNARLEKERSLLFEQGLNFLKISTARAARVLIDLLDSKDDKERRLVAKDILTLALKSAEIQDIEQRLERLEDKLI